jgi:hypothetical protein
MPLWPHEARAEIRLEEAVEIVTHPESHAHRATGRVLAWAALRAARGLPTNTLRLYRMQRAGAGA